MQNHIATIILAVMAMSTPVRAERAAYWLDAEGIRKRNVPEQALVMTLQGLVNRAGPRLLLDGHENLFEASDREWKTYFEQEKDFTFTTLPDLAAAIATFRDDLRGLVVYDHRDIAQANIALTICGLSNALPVTADMLANRTTSGRKAGAAPTRDPFEGLTVIEDLRDRFADPAAAWDWAFATLYPQCGKEFAFSFKAGDWYSILHGDLAIARKGFCLGGPSREPLFQEMFARLQPLTAVLGWADTEHYLVNAASRNGSFVVGGGPNLSFWAQVPVSEVPRWATPDVSARPLKDKYYVIFQTGDGDHVKMMTSHLAGKWLMESRGAVPMSWGMQPYVAAFAPALWEYFVRTASPNDSFFCGPSGAGYIHPNAMSDLDRYIRHTRRWMDATGVRGLEMWDMQRTGDQSIYRQYNQPGPHPPIRVFTEDRIQGGATPLAAENRWLADGTMIVVRYGGLHVWKNKSEFKNNPDVAGELIRRIEEVAAAHQPPFFISVYHHLETYLAETAQRLDQDRFEVIGLPELEKMGQEAGQFTVASTFLGTAPGEPLAVQLTVRNFGDKPRSGTIDVDVPKGWTASPPSASYAGVGPGISKTATVMLKPGEAASSTATFRFTDSGSKGWSRSIAHTVYPDSLVVCDGTTTNGWTVRGSSSLSTVAWEGRPALEVKEGGTALPLAVDMARKPVLELYLPNARSKSRITISGEGPHGAIKPVALPGSGGLLRGFILFDLAGVEALQGAQKLVLRFEARDLLIGHVRIHYRQ